MLQNFIGDTEDSAYIVNDEDLSALLKLYIEYKEASLKGDHRKTSQFYIIYINLVNYYMMLSRSIRNGDFKLFKYVCRRLPTFFLFLITKIMLVGQLKI